jgi:hypothetical protein
LAIAIFVAKTAAPLAFRNAWRRFGASQRNCFG